MGTAFCVQLQLYVFISEPQLSLNWDDYRGGEMVDSWTERRTHKTDAKRRGFATLTSHIQQVCMQRGVAHIRRTRCVW